MSNIFRRPMFRRGGDAMTGIMHNVTPRVNRFAGTPESYVTDYTTQLREAAGPYSGVDPLTAWLLRAGPRLMNEPKRGGTLATLARATAEPTEQALSDLNAKAKAERDLKLAGAQLGLDQYGKERIWEERIKATDKDELSVLDQSINNSIDDYLAQGTYTNRYHAKNRSTYDHKIQPNMIDAFGADQIIDVELVPGKDVKAKKVQKFYTNNLGKYFYDITDNTIKKIIKDPGDPTGNLLAVETFDSETLKPIDDVAPDIEGDEIVDEMKVSLSFDEAQVEADKRGLTLIPPMPEGAGRGWLATQKRQNPEAITVSELEEIIKKENFSEKYKHIKKKTRTR